MISIELAVEKILQQTRQLPPLQVDLHQAVGLILATDIVSDVDSPPHDKSTVDGYALKSSDLQQGCREFNVLETVTAGELPRQQVVSGTATQIMTGVPIPNGADCVVMVEDTHRCGENSIEVTSANYTANYTPQQNIMLRATSLKKGKQVLTCETRIRHIEAGLLAEVGISRPLIYPRPTVSILATGNELVSVEKIPQPGQIRNSNGPMLTAAVTRCGAIANHLGIARDDEASLSKKINQGLKADILLLSGGVSAGLLDLVPKTLQDHGVREIFHKVSLKPGKPLWFGIQEKHPQPTLVFGLPGNPVGGLVCFELFVQLAIKKLAGETKVQENQHTAKLMCQHAHRGGRVTYFPTHLVCNNDGQLEATPLNWHGSGDLATLSQANAFIIFPTEAKEYQPGEEVDIHMIG